jgi:hypothetical protein
MKELYKFYRAVSCLTFSVLLSGVLFSQSARTLTVHPNTVVDQYIHGFYTSLPANYTTSGKKYPLLVFLHGQGEIGDGSEASLPVVLRNGPPMQIDQQLNNNKEAHFPDPVTVGGQSWEFIVVAPQLNAWPPNGPEQVTVNNLINYAIANYRIDSSKIYLTGLSMGGGIAWEYPGYSGPLYARRLAGLLVVAGASWPDESRVIQIVQEHLPVWATHNENDPNVPSWYTTSYIDLMNQHNADPAPLMTIFPVSGHGGWLDTYGAPDDGNGAHPGIINNAGLNVYQWMAQYKRAGDNVILDVTPLPVTWGNYQAVLTDSSSVVVSWSTLLERNNRYFIVQRSADGLGFTNLDTVAATGQPHIYDYTDISPLAGVNYYRLLQVDLDGKLAYSGIMKTELSAFSQLSLRLKPNPAPDIVSLEMTNAGLGRLEVSLSDAAGKILRKWTFEKQAPHWIQAIDPGNLPPGTYFITVQGTKTREVCSFLRN